jgi:hypothetical protein
MWCMGGDESVCVALSDALKSTITLFKNRDLLAFTRDALEFSVMALEWQETIGTSVILWLGIQKPHDWWSRRYQGIPI